MSSLGKEKIPSYAQLILSLLVQPICQSGGSGLVDDAAHSQSSNLTGVAGGLQECKLSEYLHETWATNLALGVVEVSRHGDDSVGDLGAQISLCGEMNGVEWSIGATAYQQTGRLLHLDEHKGANLAGRVLLALGLDPGITVGRAEDLIRRSLPVHK